MIEELEIEEVLHAVEESEPETERPKDSESATDQQEKTEASDTGEPKPEAKRVVKGGAKYKLPEQYRNHPWAEGINDLVDEWDPKESKLPHRAMLGESYCATFFEVLGDEVHPGWIALISTGVVGGIIGSRIWLESSSKPDKGGDEGGLGLAQKLA